MLLGKKPIGTVGYLGGVMTLPEPFVWSWTQMIQYNSDYVVQGNEMIKYNHATVSYHSFARNTLVQQMQGDWLFMLDTDHQFEPDILARLLFMMNNADFDVDVLVGIYQYKSPPHSPVIYRWNKKGGNELIGDWDKFNDTEPYLMQIGSAGGGCLLIKRSVFQRIEKELHEQPFDIIAPFSEDHSFFRRLKKLKIKAYCAPYIECNHLTFKPLSLDDYDLTKVSLSRRHSIK